MKKIKELWNKLTPKTRKIVIWTCVILVAAAIGSMLPDNTSKSKSIDTGLKNTTTKVETQKKTTSSSSYSSSNRKYKSGDTGYVYPIGSKVVYLNQCPASVDAAGAPIGCSKYTPGENDKIQVLSSGAERDRGIPGGRNPIFYEVKILESEKSSYVGRTYWIDEDHISNSKW
ncbi:MAG TPA: hypothetical protein PKV16_06870 [Caldisericia bacterium]|nr:hypothetical protein [Caldisericia bacterium]HPF49489.1 hypothetical protein [Caldisericia bacterium]HPI84217.1 hypothetical protein [Caldisericia bacterium]HPQ93488.1 hypothetical protein [Caldisericia bacterium]HRV75506.1 hypothetical protein [Caldisericia bacterium]